MRRYETIVIVEPDLSEEERSNLCGKIKDLIPQQKGELITLDEWGVQRLAYEIKKKTRGYYIRLDYCGSGGLVAELERSFRIDDRVLKYMTILLEKEVDVEALKAQATSTEPAPVQSKDSVSSETVSSTPADQPVNQEAAKADENEREDNTDETEDDNSNVEEDEAGEEK